MNEEFYKVYYRGGKYKCTINLENNLSTNFYCLINEDGELLANLSKNDFNEIKTVGMINLGGVIFIPNDSTEKYKFCLLNGEEYEVNFIRDEYGLNHAFTEEGKLLLTLNSHDFEKISFKDTFEFNLSILDCDIL